MLVLTPSVLKLSSGDDGRESLFRYETAVVERSAPGYRIAPSHLVFTKPTLLRAAARFAVTTPLAVKPRCRRALRSHGRHRVRKRSSRVAAESLPLLGAAARIHAGRSHGRHRVRQRSSRVAVLFFLLVAWFRGFYLLPKFEAERWLFLIGSADPERQAACNTTHHHAPRTTQKFQFSPAAVSAESPPVVRDFYSKLRAPHRSTSLGPFVCGANNSALNNGSDLGR
jgi:hypothetical protein